MFRERLALQVALSPVRTDDTPKIRFSATVGEKPEVHVGVE